MQYLATGKVAGLSYNWWAFDLCAYFYMIRFFLLSCSCRFKTQPRLLVSLVLVIILFAVTAGLTKIPTDHWQSSFMTLTLVTVVIINLNAAIFQGKKY